MQNRKKILFVGLTTIDMQFFVDGFPAPNTKTKASHNAVAAGGPATNAAIVASVLGSDVTLLSPIGKHSLARFVMDDITTKGVKLIDPIDHIESKPIFASIITDQLNGERTIFSYHPEQDHAELLREIKLDDPEKYDLVLFDGFYPDLAIPLAKRSRELGITTILDGGSWKPGNKELLQHIDIAICSNDFIPPASKNKADVFSELQNSDISKIAITRGGDPILVLEDLQKDQLPVKRIEVLDSLGAGDFFHGAFCHYYNENTNFKEALKNATNVAQQSCLYHGTRSWLDHLSQLKEVRK